MNSSSHNQKSIKRLVVDQLPECSKDELNFWEKVRLDSPVLVYESEDRHITHWMIAKHENRALCMGDAQNKFKIRSFESGQIKGDDQNFLELNSALKSLKNTNN